MNELALKQHPDEPLRELALFAGAGGGILGGKLLGWRTVCAVEWDAYARDVLVARQNDGCLEAFPIWDDVQTFDGRPWRGRVDIVSGGFPCQDISCAGKGAGIDGARSGMWGHMARVIGEVRPRFVLVENSPMLVGRGLTRVLSDLATLGYDAHWGVVGAHHAGAPHKRDRIWIVATDSTLHPREQRRAQCKGFERETGITDGCDELGNTDDNGQPAAEVRESPSQGSHGSPPRKGPTWQPTGPGEQYAQLADTKSERCGETRELRSGEPTERTTSSSEEINGNVADTESLGSRSGSSKDQSKLDRNIAGNSGGLVAHALRDRPQGSGQDGGATGQAALCNGERRNQEQHLSATSGDWWATEPDVGGETDGMATKLDGI